MAARATRTPASRAPTPSSSSSMCSERTNPRRPRRRKVTKSERLLNLLILLLVQRNPVTKQKIRATIPDYQDASDEAFDRMFERDKDELRAIGVPLEIAAIDRFFGDETGYRIRPDEFALPGINLTADEAAVVRSEEHTSELQSLMRISYTVFCLKKKKTKRE